VNKGIASRVIGGWDICGLWTLAERGSGTHQDRLIKKMGRKKIRTHEAGNRFLQEEYLAQHNARFAREPCDAL
jgi:hypothetical protein